MKLDRVCLMLGVAISFLILIPIPSIFRCVATVPPEDDPKTSSFVDPPHVVQTLHPQEGTWLADTNIFPGDKPLPLHVSEWRRRIEEADPGLVFILRLEEALASNQESAVASALEQLSTEPDLGLQVASTLADLLPATPPPLVRSTRSEVELTSDDPPPDSLCESEPDRRELEEADAIRDSDDVERASNDSTWGSCTESPLSSASTLDILEWILACPLSWETEEVASTWTTNPRGRESELAVDSTGHSSTPDSSPTLTDSTPSSIAQSSDLASASTPHIRELELACHLNEATPLDGIAIHDIERDSDDLGRASDDSPRGSRTESPLSLASSLDSLEWRLACPLIRETEEVAPASITTPHGCCRETELAVDSTGLSISSIPESYPTLSSIPQLSSDLAGHDLNEATPVDDYHAIDIDTEQVDPPQQPPITSTGDDQLGIAIRCIGAVYRNENLGRDVLGYVVPVTLGMLTMNTRPSPTVVNLVLISTVVGFAAIWNGLLLRTAFPRFANRIELFGVAQVLASFFGLLSTYLPPSLAWLPWLCWALAIAPFTLTFSADHQSRAASGPVQND